MGKNRTLALLLASAALSTALPGTAAFAQSVAARPTFDVPGGDLNAALKTYAAQAGIEIVWAEADVRGLRSRSLSGQYEPREALRQLIDKAPLDIVADASGAVTLRRRAPLADAGPTSSEIVVTGTRLNEEFAGAAPVQTIDRERAAASGLFETAEVLRTQPQVSGPRSQLRYEEGQTTAGGSRGGAGPGSQTIALRGLSPSQTLVLLNGRRVVAAGVEGVPRSADLSLIPSGLVREFRILTEGASPVYGTDAIAGIVDVRLRQDIDRTSVQGSLSQPEAGGGTIGNISLTTGKTFDRGFIGLGVEYRQSQGLELRRARRSGPDCPAFYDRQADGSFRENNLIEAALPGTTPSPCQRNFGSLAGFFQAPSGALFFATPGRTNISVPNFSTNQVSNRSGTAAPASFGFRPFDSNANGVINTQDAFFPDPDGDGRVGFELNGPEYNLFRQERARRSTLISPLKQINLFTYGQHDTDVLGNATAFFEASFNQRRTEQRNSGQVISPASGGSLFRVPVTNPTNPCGFEQGRCYSENFNAAAFTVVAPYVSIAGDNDSVRTQLRQYRLVAGLRGELGFLNGLGGDSLGFSNWKYEVSVNAGRSVGTSQRPLFLRDRLGLSLQTTVRNPATGQLVCGTDGNGDGLPDDPASCMPVNLFTQDALLNNRLTPAETAYLLGSLDYRTQVDLMQVNAFISGEAIRLPGGPINWVLGGELRRDAIDASGNDVARSQNFASSSLFTDPGAKGSRTVTEVFGEIGIPLLKERRFFHALNFSAAGRVTREEFSGTNGTYSVRGRWEPAPWIAFRGTYGTSFRSPNTYELFTQPFAQDFPLRFFDPCNVPFAAQAGGVYNPTGETRTAETLARCRAAGADPTVLGLDPFAPTPPSTIQRGSALDDLKPETSTALTAGGVLSLGERFWPQGGFFNKFNINLSATYYEIRIKNEIQQGDFQSVLGGCYINPAQLYCERITRGAGGFLTNVRDGFINGPRRQTRGLDFNALAQKGFRVGQREFDLAMELAGNYEFSVFSSIGRGTEFSGTLDYPKLKMNGTVQLRQGSWFGTWYTNFVGKASVFPNFRFTEGTYSTCPSSGGTTCAPVQDVDNYFLHNVSVGYVDPTWLVTVGVNNVFDTAPPRLSVLATGSNPLNTRFTGNYDIYGRTLTLRVRRNF